MSARGILRILVLFLVSLSSCSGGGGGSSEELVRSDLSEVTLSSSLRVTSFNTGLLPTFVALSAERSPAVAAALAAHQTDVLCVQELWQSGDFQRVSSALLAAYPFQLSVPARQRFAEQSPVCGEDDLDPMLLCIAQSCGLGGGGVVECAATSCRSQLFALSERNSECAAALFAQTGRSVFELFSIQAELFDESEQARLFAYEGSSGLLLASKHEIVRTEIVDFFDASTTSRRAALLASIRKNGELHHVACTHLSSNLEGVLPYTGRFGSWEAEGREQSERLISAANRFASGGPQYLAGDFNCSLANGGAGVGNEFPSNCARFLNAGYRDPAGEQLGCSFCTSNPLVADSTSLASTESLLLDHIFVKDLFSDSVQAAIVLDQTVSLEGVSSPLSDHYAVEITAQIP